MIRLVYLAESHDLPSSALWALLIADISNNPTEYLKMASRNGDRDIVEIAISKGASELGKGMVCAAYRGHRDLVEFFISKGATNWYLGLFCASNGGHTDLVEFFKSQRAND